MIQIMQVIPALPGWRAVYASNDVEDPIIVEAVACWALTVSECDCESPDGDEENHKIHQEVVGLTSPGGMPSLVACNESEAFMGFAEPGDEEILAEYRAQALEALLHERESVN